MGEKKKCKRGGGGRRDLGVSHSEATKSGGESCGSAVGRFEEETSVTESLLFDVRTISEHLRNDVGCRGSWDGRSSRLASRDSMENLSVAFVFSPVDELVSSLPSLSMSGLDAVEELPNLDELLHDRRNQKNGLLPRRDVLLDGKLVGLVAASTVDEFQVALETVDLDPAVGLEIHSEFDRLPKSFDRELSEGGRQTREGHVVVLSSEDVDDGEYPLVDSGSSSEFGLGEDEDGE
ncbi:hypothetical protein BDY24DRAFT_396535, partial [Mrakia frigida]|uniref:uncharacterized protein n=1 Tax=Mrakia frigida TaxID=29902 RepID=UPI003FCC1F45